MKGVVFIAFNQMVEDQLGIDVWERLLNDVIPESGGVYTSVEQYPDSELFNLVGALSNIVDVPVPTLVEQFGAYMFDILNSKYPIFTEQQADFFSFIKSIDGVIHREVKKLYNNPNLPSLDCKQIDKNTLEITYRSPRKLCFLAEGLIRGAAKYYNVKYALSHNRCMHDGNDHCLLVLAME
jgi:predicted hydrocarbon binding protein